MGINDFFISLFHMSTFKKMKFSPISKSVDLGLINIFRRRRKSQLKRKYNKSKQVKMSPLPRTSKQLLMTTTAGRCPKQRKARDQRKPIMPKVIKIMARRIHENNQRNSQRKRKRRSKRSRKW